MDNEPNYKHDAKNYLYDGNGFHCHKCDICGTVWQHPNPPEGIDKDLQHLCPNPTCDGEQRWKMDLRDVTKIDFPFTGEWRK